jgi:hypothetical protein
MNNLGILEKCRRFVHELQEWRALNKLPRNERRLVIYSEGKGYWTYFAGVYEALHSEHGEQIIYVTSARDDPQYLQAPSGMRSYCVGDGFVRTLFFSGLDADVLLMTMPDLQTFHIKRSFFPVHYSYLHHSMVSMHMAYRSGAFDHFDSILCTGPHHVSETRAMEKIYGTQIKQLVEHGYGRLDMIMADIAAAPKAPTLDQTKQVLVAPTWGQNGLVESYGLGLVEPLLAAGLRVVLRPHPRTRILSSELLDQIADHFRDNPMFRMDEDGDSRQSLLESNILVSDWSGAALEFAFGLARPVIFVETPRKVLNSGYEKVGMEPFEVHIRKKIGIVLQPKQLPALGEHALALLREAGDWQQAIKTVRAESVFQLGHSGRSAAAFLVSLLPRQ